MNGIEGRNGWLAVERVGGSGPTVVFLGGFMSDMGGTKAVWLEGWARRNGRAFVRFDYTGHGQSSGRFADGCIGDWFGDACDVIGSVAGPVILVGSSMGGWISLLIARALPERVVGLVTIAAAPDFTEDSIWAGFSNAERAILMDEGKVLLPSDYGAPYVITRRLIEEGRTRLVLRSPIEVAFPVRSLQGTGDAEVDGSVALRLLDTLRGDDVRLTLVQGADHRFSSPDCLDLIAQSIAEVTERSA